MIRKLGFYALAAFYLLAGINHFIDPDFYYGLIPPWLPWPVTINVLSGVAEIVLAIGLLLPATRKLSAWLIVLMLLAFIPSHVYFIQIGSCVEGGLCTPAVVGWVRLVVIHPLLIWWAWAYRHYGL